VEPKKPTLIPQILLPKTQRFFFFFSLSLSPESPDHTTDSLDRDKEDESKTTQISKSRISQPKSPNLQILGEFVKSPYRINNENSWQILKSSFPG
jgi:hypothetical protein